MNESREAAERRARNRFIVMSALRLGGVAMVLASLLLLNGVIPLPRVVGWVGLVIGLCDIFIVPQVLARAWRTPVP
ncbi:MAG: hypothetical protein WCY92_07275 [Novosphingobium sp.]|uniref:hypothetical protein n=1 Tax=Tsuneonella sp. CC-YZS046 TaxID=3042152 RepID=UPI002D798E8C|nr:hypothetical protein [Tsuneonella sp. CC-YZS046]WRO66880.1 hypothetical protein U8326_01545 [Tsuneonella sp. CC-YZS046]